MTQHTKEYNWGTLTKLILRYKKELIIANIIGIISTLISVPTPLFIPLLIDEVLLDKPSYLVNTIDIFFNDATIFHYVIIVLLVLIALRTIVLLMNIFQIKTFAIISKNIIFNTRKRILMHLEKISIKEYEMLESGSIASKLITDLNTIEDFIGKTISRFTTSLLSLIAICGILTWINPYLALIIILLNPIVIIISSKMSKKVASYKKEENESISIFQESLIETLEMFTQIRSSNKEQNYISKLITKADNVRKNAILFGYKAEAQRNVSFYIFLMGVEFFRVATIIIVFHDQISIGLMLGVFAYLWFMMGPIEELLNIQYNFDSASVAIKRIDKILQIQQEQQYPNKKNPFDYPTSIEIEKLNFSFGDKVILKDLSLKINEKEKIAIIGSSGDGKTTLMQVLIGLYPPDNGDIKFNKISIRDIGLNTVRENVFLILQSPLIFNDTVRENLCMGQIIKEETIFEALKIAQLDEFVNQMPDKLNSYLGKNGIRLSGGQKQRLAIARMILKNPRVVIFDESTSALDSKTEKMLFKALKPYLKDKTVIMIAHRLNTIKNADNIYMIKDKTIKKIQNKEKFLKKHIRIK